MSSAPVRQHSERHDLLLAPPHRLFVVFDSREVAEAALRRLRAEELAPEDEVWVLAGEEGLSALDAAGTRHGVRGRVVRLLQMAMTVNDIQYLEILEADLAAGHVVLAIPVANQRRADEIARLLREQAGHSMAYGAHWDFVPVVP
ncbi:MAG TPA: hypothetical protein VFN50_11955 [Acidimicrobiales bacterium]|nr:hypothetical protein [Acidimicrobiales bacterium]